MLGDCRNSLSVCHMKSAVTLSRSLQEVKGHFSESTVLYTTMVKRRRFVPNIVFEVIQDTVCKGNYCWIMEHSRESSSDREVSGGSYHTDN